MYRTALILAGAVVLSACATVSYPVPEIVSVPEYREYLDYLRSQIDEGVPRELNDQEMAHFRRLSRTLNGLLADVGHIDELEYDDKIRVFNLNEELHAVVIGRDEDQVVCKRQRTVGTNFRTTTCRTLSDVRREREGAARWIREDVMQRDRGAPVTDPR